jgi:hypothetical protein
VNIIESQIGDITVIRVVDRPAAATLELHHQFYTFYWRCRYRAIEFMNRVPLSIAERQSTTVTIVSDSGKTKIYPYKVALEAIYLWEQRPSVNPLEVLRIDANALSWAWQYAPDDIDPAFSEAPSRPGFLPYAGCASNDDHLAHFETAAEFLRESAIGASILGQHLYLIFGYLQRWESGP